LLIDIHVHTSTFSPCGRSTPDEMVISAREYGLEALVFTEHNILWPADRLAELQARHPGVRLFRGVEVTIDSGDHLLVYGVHDEDVLREGTDGAALAARVRRMGGAVVLAHPYRYGPSVPSFLSDHPVDGIEILSNNMLNYAHVQARALCARLGAHPVAASDAHHVDTVGLYALRLDEAVQSERALAVALRGGAYRLHVDRARVAALNSGLSQIIADVERLIALGRSDDEIHRELDGLGYTTIRGIREGLDVGKPM